MFVKVEQIRKDTHTSPRFHFLASFDPSRLWRIQLLVMSLSRPLTAFSALSFDCYGTLVDWESGIVNGLQPLIRRLSSSDASQYDKNALLERYIYHEGVIQTKNPEWKYTVILEHVYEALAVELRLQDFVTPEEKTAFGASIKEWPAFPDTVSVLKELNKHYKLIILSNVDNDSFNRTLAGPLAEVKFDAVYVAEDIGTYKPNLHNFEYLVEHTEQAFQIPKERLLHTAYALHHDLVPAHEIGLATCWIERKPNAIGGELSEVAGRLELAYQFAELADLAEAAKVAFDALD